MVDNSDLEWILDKQLAWIASADSKLTILAPLPIAMLAISLSNVVSTLKVIELADWPLLLSTVLLCISLFFVKAALTPRLQGPVDSNVFFGRIAEKEFQKFQEELLDLKNEDYRSDIVKQIHRNATIANHKHKNISRSVWWLACATPIWLFAIALGQ